MNEDGIPKEILNITAQEADKDQYRNSRLGEMSHRRKSMEEG
jgi:hypothetical protein